MFEVEREMVEKIILDSLNIKLDESDDKNNSR